MKIDGQVTISIQQYEELKAAADELEEKQGKSSQTETELQELVAAVDDAEYLKIIDEIDRSKTMTDRKVTKRLDEGQKTMKIIVDTDILKKLIRRHIDENASESHMDLKRMKLKDFMNIEVQLKGKEQQAEEQPKELCIMCQEYMADEECDNAKDCPAAAMHQKLKEALKEVDKLKKQVKAKQKEIDKVNLEKSYMINPNCIGDRHEMGG